MNILPMTTSERRIDYGDVARYRSADRLDLWLSKQLLYLYQGVANQPLPPPMLELSSELEQVLRGCGPKTPGGAA
jgi:hypothetical protein